MTKAVRRTVVVTVIGALFGASCAAGSSGGEAALSEGRGSSAAAAAVARDPAPVVAAAVPVATTVPVPTTAVAVASPAPSGLRPYLPAGTPTTTIVRRTPPPGVTTHGYGDLGWQKQVTSGATSVNLMIYAADIYLDQSVSVHAGVSFTGAPKATKLDFGDGTVVAGPEVWAGMGCPPYPAVQRLEGRSLINGNTHTYAKPGLYTITATITIIDCQIPAFIPVAPPPPGSPLLPSGPPPTLVPIGFGNDSSVSVSLQVLVWPEKVPPPIGPPPGP